MSAPELSVVVPSFNRRTMLHRCLGALARQTHPGSFEVVVVDDGSSDGTAAMVAAFDAPYGLRLLQRRQGGWAASQNAGIEASTGRICLLIDDDIVVSPQLVAAHLAGHESGGPAIGVGPLVQRPPDVRDWYAEAFAEEWGKHYAELSERSAVWTDCYGGNLSAPRAELLESGGFATDLLAAADIELAFRLCRAGCIPRYLPQAEAVHDDQKPGRRLLEDTRLRGLAYLQIAERHPEAEAELLGWFRTGSGREIAARRLLIALAIPPSALAALGGAIPSAERRIFWHHMVQRFAFWRSVRRQVDRTRWRALVRGEIAVTREDALEAKLP